MLKSIPTAQLIIVGSGPEDTALRIVADKLAISDAVEFKGSLVGNSLIAEYRAASCLILPSRSETWGLVVNEALAQGCPAVVSNQCGCVPELIVQGETGFAFPFGDTNSLAAKLSEALKSLEIQG